MASEDTSPAPGLYLVATPIGNLSDWTPRAQCIVQQADYIACEDTRHSSRLFQNLELKAHPQAYHEHNEQQQAPKLADAVASGKVVALLTDAGTPGISDPGFRVVRECRARGLPVFSVPGPVAFAVAWSISGLPTDSLLFLGFLPPKTAARQRIFAQHKESTATIAFYESTHRIAKCINDIITVLGPERCICLARELTKLHETVLTGPAGEVQAQFEKISSKGEFVVLIAKEGFSL
ncbi:MAG: 16S rRNA (cytidine(1402)-2'-O)-methyltransferase [Verrucomicrobia bacterium]|nr:16S rRNA (cytidine(1402)-2'-O)-methyltransferase [Verrucomicrobiota bacterium]